MKNARIDWFRAVRVSNFGPGRQDPCSGDGSAQIGTPSGRDAEPLPHGGRGSVLHGRVRRPRSLLAGSFSLSGLCFLFGFSFTALIPWHCLRAETPAVTEVRLGTHDFGTRLVLDLNTDSAAYQISLARGGGAVEIEFFNLDWYPATERLIGDDIIEAYAFTLVGASGGRLTLTGAVPLKIINSFPLSPSGESGHRLVFDLAESPGAPPAAAGPRREEPLAVYGTPPMASTEPSSRAPTVTSIAELPKLAPPEPLAIDGGDATRPIDPLQSSPADATGTGDEEKRLVLQGINIDGAKAVTSRTFEPFYRDWIGKSVSLKDLNGIADDMTAAMRNKGYVLYKVIVPQQEIVQGRVRLQAIEGYINQVVVEGEVGGRADLWRHWVERIKSERPITAAVLERYTLLANDLAGKTVKSVLRAAEGVPGASDLVLKVTEKHIEAKLTVDNRASPSTGPNEATAVVTTNNALGVGEKVSITYNMAADPDQQKYLAAQMDMPLNGEGTTVTVSGTLSTSAPGGSLKDLELTSESLGFSAGLTHPLIRRRDETVKVFGGFTYTDAGSDALSSRLYEDKITTVNGGMSYSLNDKLDGENALSLKMTQGVEWLGAKASNDEFRSRDNGQTNFTKFSLSASRLQRLPRDLTLSATFSGQWASAPLLSSEEFSFGGSSYGRAYDSSEITGDHGMALALELQYTMKPGVSKVKYLQPYAFWDYGATLDIDADDDPAKRTGSSAGLGLRFGITDHFTAGLEVAKPLSRSVSSADDGEGDDPRFFFTFSGLY